MIPIIRPKPTHFSSRLVDRPLGRHLLVTEREGLATLTFYGAVELRCLLSPFCARRKRYSTRQPSHEANAANSDDEYRFGASIRSKLACRKGRRTGRMQGESGNR